MVNPLVILLIGVVAVIAMIVVLRINAFIALITAAIVVSLLSPGALSDKVSRVAEAFGSVVGSIGIVIAMAAVIGKCMMDSGAADRIVRSFMKALGQKHAYWALTASGFTLAIPVFFDTVFYLLVPLARSLYRQTQKNYLLYVLAIVAGASITHTLVPPTPGPLFVAERLGVDMGLMIIMGITIGLPSSIVGLLVCKLISRYIDVPMRPYSGQPEPEPLADQNLPPLWLSLAPVALPVILIAANTIAKALVQGSEPTGPAANFAQITAMIGNPNFALLISAAIAMSLVVWKRKLSLRQLEELVDNALMSGGMIILITAGGGAFGAMLRQAGIQTYVEHYVKSGGYHVGIAILLIAFVVGMVLKLAQGSTTVAMITTASMFAAMGITSQMLGCHLVYLALVIGCGSLVGDWMNNSGFWLFCRMSVLTETETLKSWTILTAALGIAGLVFTLLFAGLLPLV